MVQTRILAVWLAAIGLSATGYAINIDTVLVGQPGNAADTRYETPGFGAVSYRYRIAATEVTNAQYVDFLNSVAASDPYELYHPDMGSKSWGGIIRSGSAGGYTYMVKPSAVGEGPGNSDYTYADKPVVYVSWFDAVRFANWLHNGQGSGGTESGAYTLSGGTPIPNNPEAIARNSGAQWFLPSEDEWYKAAYYDPVGGFYYDYPTGGNTHPDNNLPSADSGNSVNVHYQSHYTTDNSLYPMTDAGAYTQSGSPYGTFDQGGNVIEMTESLFAGFRSIRGGSWNTDQTLPAEYAGFVTYSAASQYDYIGFRVARSLIYDDFGDYNHDNFVDGADYVIWRNDDGTPAGYQNWRENFGTALPDGSARSIGIPEPVAWPMSIILLPLFLFCKGRNRWDGERN